MVSIQLWSADCHIFRGDSLIPGQLCIGSEEVVFKATRKHLLGLAGTSSYDLWKIGVFEVDSVRADREAVIIEGRGIRVRFQFKRGDLHSALSGITYTLEVAKRKAREQEFSMKRLMHGHMQELDRTKGYQ